MALSSAKNYLPIIQRESEEDGDDEKEWGISSTESESRRVTHLRATYSVWWLRWVPWILVLCLLISNGYTWARIKNLTPDNEVFSPARSAIKYQNVVFTSGQEDDISPYQGWPTKESNQLWKELYNYGVIQLPINDAAQLVNRTTPIPGEKGQYVVILSVFHQLHCLSNIRKRLLWNSTTESPDSVESLELSHLDHCIDSIRQSLMCSSDITPVPFAWWPKYQKAIPTIGVTHTCRDFDAIRDWAKEHRAGKMDTMVHVDDPLGNVVYGPPSEDL